MFGKWVQLIIVMALVVLSDQASKLAIIKWLAPIGRVKVIPGFFNLVYVMNSGMAFGLLSGNYSTLRVVLLTASALVAVGAIIYFVHTSGDRERLFIFGLSLVAGGAIGNMIDRLRFGGVVDFLDFYISSAHWPSFNLADAGVTVGTIILLIHFWRAGSSKEARGAD